MEYGKMIRQLIREMILEDLDTFKARTSHIEPFYDPVSKVIPRELKSIWNDEADHTFFDGLTKVHWIRSSPGNLTSVSDNLIKFLKASRKDEIATMGYIGNPKPSMWGEFGVMVQGRTTFAANNMNSVFSGNYSDISKEDIKKYAKTSGLPRRPSLFTPGTTEHLTFGAQDFRDIPGPGNELIVDNWRPIGLVAPAWFFKDMEKNMKKFNKYKGDIELWQLMNVFLRTKRITGLDLPIYSSDGRIIDMETFRAMVTVD
jgi:hypothetical protein